MNTGLKFDRILLVVLSSYFISRLMFLWQIPLFEDEALFTGWSKQMIVDSAEVVAPLAAGIGPLFSWLTALITLLVSNQFLAGRLISMFAGALLIGTLFIYVNCSL